MACFGSHCPFRLRVSHRTQELSSKFLLTELGIRQGASWRTSSVVSPTPTRALSPLDQHSCRIPLAPCSHSCQMSSSAARPVSRKSASTWNGVRLPPPPRLDPAHGLERDLVDVVPERFQGGLTLADVDADGLAVDLEHHRPARARQVRRPRVNTSSWRAWTSHSVTPWSNNNMRGYARLPATLAVLGLDRAYVTVHPDLRAGVLPPTGDRERLDVVGCWRDQWA